MRRPSRCGRREYLKRDYELSLRKLYSYCTLCMNAIWVLRMHFMSQSHQANVGR
ncbi:hypothetical protein K440DRAFT_168541 [Wilcoxina mikolae CBS 423.85]|nr:hypothetical protein K440DRAFT_168541 [Wilcoxina mikolae CBS 423.85]